MLIGLKANQDLLHQLTAVQAAMRCASKSDTMRRLIVDAYENFFVRKMTIDSKPTQEKTNERND